MDISSLLSGANTRDSGDMASNGLGGGAMGGGGDMQKLMEALRRQTAYMGQGGMDPLSLLLAIIGGGGGGVGGGTGGGQTGGGSGGGLTACLRGDTLVLMGDRKTRKPIEDVRVNDVVMGWDIHHGFTPQTVSNMQSANQPTFRIEIQGLADQYPSPSHRWFTCDGLKLTTELTVGMQLIPERVGFIEPHKQAMLKDEDVPIITAITPDAVAVVHWFNCEPNHCFFAGGVLHHNVTVGAKSTGEYNFVPGDPNQGSVGAG